MGSGAIMSETYDLIYCENRGEYLDYQKRLKEIFPDCTFEDASDYVHTHRFVIKRDVPVDDEYYMGLIKAGIGGQSLTIQFALIEKQGTIMRVLDKLEAEAQS